MKSIIELFCPDPYAMVYLAQKEAYFICNSIILE